MAQDQTYLEKHSDGRWARRVAEREQAMNWSEWSSETRTDDTNGDDWRNNGRHPQSTQRVGCFWSAQTRIRTLRRFSRLKRPMRVELRHPAPIATSPSTHREDSSLTAASGRLRPSRPGRGTSSLSAAAVLGWIIWPSWRWAMARSGVAFGGPASSGSLRPSPSSAAGHRSIFFSYKALVDQGALALVALWVASWAASVYFLLGWFRSSAAGHIDGRVVAPRNRLVVSPALVVLALLLFAASGSGSSPAARPFNSSAMEVRSAGARLSQIERQGPVLVARNRAALISASVTRPRPADALVRDDMRDFPLRSAAIHIPLSPLEVFRIRPALAFSTRCCRVPRRMQWPLHTVERRCRRLTGTHSQLRAHACRTTSRE